MNQADCIFCKIVAGEIPCAKVLETDTVLAFLDIAPVARGHALVIPKAHFPTVLDIDPALGPDILAATARVGRALMRATGATGFNVGLNCNPSAGQLVFHAHWHLVPRIEGDGLTLWPTRKYDSMDEMSRLAATIGAHV